MVSITLIYIWSMPRISIMQDSEIHMVHDLHIYRVYDLEMYSVWLGNVFCMTWKCILYDLEMYSVWLARLETRHDTIHHRAVMVACIIVSGLSSLSLRTLSLHTQMYQCLSTLSFDDSCRMQHRLTCSCTQGVEEEGHTWEEGHTCDRCCKARSR